MLADVLLEGEDPRFRTHEEVTPLIKEASTESTIARYEAIGASEEGRPLYGVVMGEGPHRIGLLGGAHSDEPAGPETLRTFILQGLRHSDELSELWQRFTFVVIPHINPDGEAENWSWIEEWPDPDSYLLHRFRELPGRDLEFGYPFMRPENDAVSSFLKSFAPFSLYINFHGMGLSEGALLLIERHWIERTEELREEFRGMVEEHDLSLHDHDRGGEKGFIYIAPGFSTTPEGEAMRQHFLEKGDEEMASNFHQSSMEFVRSLGGDPLCLVTEFPLYLIGKRVPDRAAGHPVLYLELKDRLPELKEDLRRGESIDPVLEEYDIRPVPLRTTAALHLETLELGLEHAV